MDQGDSRPGSHARLDGPREAGATCALDVDAAWQALLTLRRHIDDRDEERAADQVGLVRGGDAWTVAEPTGADLLVGTVEQPTWQARLPVERAAGDLLDLHLPHATRQRAAGYVLAVLGQSLDGYIATEAGNSRYINGEDGLTHLHRLRALSDAVVIGVSTAIADCPSLTTRHVPGPHAVRVVIDPHGRLPADSGLLCDEAAETLVVRGTDGAAFATRLSAQAVALHLSGRNGTIAPADVVTALAARGLTRLLIEGGGVTVSRFLEGGQLDRLQLVVSPLILGKGRPALPVTPASCLDQARRLSGRRHVLGEDVLFDLRVERLANGAA